VTPSSDRNITELLHLATAHPLRRHILRILKASDSPLAPVDLVDHTGEKLSTISYHFKMLFKAGFVDLVKTEPRRGAVKHYYKPSEAFTAEIKDALALDRIAELLETEAAESSKSVLKEIADVVVASGRPIR
jgi:DNA-binding transcriptional ArsR family regulator